MASRAIASPSPVGSHSHTLPQAGGKNPSSQESHVPHGVGPPEQLEWLPDRIGKASRIWPSASKWTDDAPPWFSNPVMKLNTSLLHA